MEHESIVLPPGGQEIVHVPELIQTRSLERWNQSCVKGIGISLIITATISMVGILGFLPISEFYAAEIAWVTWIAGVVFAAGVVITVCGVRPSYCLMNSVMVLSIIAAVFDTGFIIIGGLHIGFSNDVYLVGLGVLFIATGVICFGLLLLMSIMGCSHFRSRENVPSSVAYISHSTSAEHRSSLVVGRGSDVGQPLLQEARLKAATSANELRVPTLK